jgi:hypothetical protein
MALRIASTLAVVLLLSASPLWGQAQQEPETRTVTITSLHMPPSLFDEFRDYVKKYNLPVDKENPHILGFRYLFHHWGGNDPNVWIMTEYRNLGEIYQAEEWADKRFEKMFPDSAQREAIGKEFEDKFGEYYSNHTDNITSGRVEFMKFGK